jgi:hypothetical protein
MKIHTQYNLPELPKEGVEPARGIELPTCALQITERGLLKALTIWAIRSHSNTGAREVFRFSSVPIILFRTDL